MQERFKTFTVLIAKINRCIKKLKHDQMSSLDLKSPHVSCLYYLYTEGELTAKQLCDICDEDKSGISRSIDYLEQRGYVCCDEHIKKRYKSPLKLTEKGRNVGKWLSEKIDNILGLTSLGLSEQERAIFYKGLKVVSCNLQRLCSATKRSTF